MTTLDFIRHAHATATFDDGSCVYDGYFPTSALGDEPVPATPVPVIHVVNECEFVAGLVASDLSYRRDDADQVGASTDSTRWLAVLTRAREAGSSWRTSPIFDGVFGAGEQASQYLQAMLWEAALRNLIQWVAEGVPAPRAEPIRASPSGEILRDNHGNALGGVRVSHLDVPVARYIASAPADSNNFFRRVVGLEEPFTRGKLIELYGDRANMRIG